MNLSSRRRFMRTLLLAGGGALSGCALPAPWKLRASVKPGRSPRSSPSLASSPVRGLPEGYRLTYTSCHVDGPLCAMTFDDGPHPELTPRLLEMLKEWKLKATFYLVGKNANAFPRLVARILEEGHEIGNHSWDHPVLSGLSDQRVMDQLRRTHDAIVNGCGTPPATFRPPYGAATVRQKEWIAAEFGYPAILWDVDTNDWKDHNPPLVSQRILNGTRSGSIILAHDIHATSVAAMPLALPVLRDKGFQFLTVTELIKRELGGRPVRSAAPVPAPATTLYSPGAF